jgi:hypothetical protein
MWSEADPFDCNLAFHCRFPQGRRRRCAAHGREVAVVLLVLLLVGIVGGVMTLLARARVIGRTTESLSSYNGLSLSARTSVAGN